MPAPTDRAPLPEVSAFDFGFGSFIVSGRTTAHPPSSGCSCLRFTKSPPFLDKILPTRQAASSSLTVSCFNSPTARLKEKFAVVEAWLKHLRAAGWKEDAAPLTVMAGMLSLFRVDQHLSVNFNASGFTLAEVEVSSNGVGLEQISAKKRLAVRCMPSILDLGWGKNLAPEFRHSAHPSVRRRVSSTR